jgi:hypothetical protein
LFSASSGTPSDNSASPSLLGVLTNPLPQTNMGSYPGPSINAFAVNMPSPPAFATGTVANLPQNLLLQAAAPFLSSPATFPDFQLSSLPQTNSSQTEPQSVQSAPLFDWRALLGLAGGSGPNISLDPLGWARVILAAGGDRERIDPEEIFDPIAPLRVDMYNAARAALRQIQPNNYTLSVVSLRAPGSAPTRDEVGEMIIAQRVAQITQPLADMASRIAGLVEPFAQNFRTVSVLRTSSGTYVAGSGRVDLEDDQLDAVAAAGAIQVPAAAGHAEIAALDYARSRGEFPQFVASSRPFCPDCRREIENRGGYITSPTTAVFPQIAPSVAFPSR